MLDSLSSRPVPTPADAILEARGLSVRTDRRPILEAVDLSIVRGEVLALIGPSGAGKSTLLRCLNRLVDLVPELHVRGEVLFAGTPIYRPSVDPDRLRTRIGMLFQQPVIFPGSIADNVVFGLRHAGGVAKREWPERVRRALTEAALWREVSDRLDEPAGRLSVGQQQRLCLARALALEPEVILMDEPTSSLDPASTRAIEELVGRLREHHTLVLVTHQPAQARRVADRIGCLCIHEGAGRLIEVAGATARFDHVPCWEAREELEATGR